jgi:hypothetical protein
MYFYTKSLLQPQSMYDRGGHGQTFLSWPAFGLLLTLVSPVAISSKSGRSARGHAYLVSSRAERMFRCWSFPPFLGRSFSEDAWPRLCAPVTSFPLHCSEILDYRQVRRYLSESGYERKTDDIQVYGRTARLVSLWAPVSIS